MKNLILKYGLLAGVIVAVPMGFMTVVMGHDLPMAWGMVIGYTSMLLAFSLILVATKRHRDQNLGGVIRFWPAFGMGLAITLVASLIYSTTWEVITMSTDMNFMESYSKAVLAEEKARGASAEVLAQKAAEMEAFAKMYANPLFRFMMTLTEILPIGILVSLICAVLIRRPGFMPARPSNA